MNCHKDKTPKNLRKIITVSALLITFIAAFIFYEYMSVPQDFSIFEGEEYTIHSSIPITVEINNENNVVTVNNKVFDGEVTLTAAKQNEISNNIAGKVKLFGLFPIKEINVDVLPRIELMPSGVPINVKLFTSGIMIIGLSDINTQEGKLSPSYDAGIRAKDIIVKINGNEVNTIEQLTDILNNCNGQSLKIEYKRDSNIYSCEVKPIQSSNGSWKLGIWVRDSAAGIGTVTFVDLTTGFFGSLGHGICDVDTGELMPLDKGSVQLTSITGVVKGEKGLPGELQGVFLSQPEDGILVSNNETGIFGYFNNYKIWSKNNLMPIALRNQIKTGPAEILCCISGNIAQAYKIEIVRINYSNQDSGRNLLIKIKDERLLSATGGIVQGMSGSPIIQNGRLIGAVTHVLVDDPQSGYGIFIENMLKNIKNREKNASSITKAAFIFI